MSHWDSKESVSQRQVGVLYPQAPMPVRLYSFRLGYGIHWYMRGHQAYMRCIIKLQLGCMQ